MPEEDFADLHDLEENLWGFAGMRRVTAPVLDAKLATRTAVLSAEALLLRPRWMRLPFGLSAVCVVRRPATGAS